MPISVMASVLLGAGCDEPGASTEDAAQLDASVPALAPDAPPDETGRVTAVVAGCAAGVGALPGTTCETLTVACPGADDQDVQLRVTEPPVGVARRGTVILGSDSGGRQFLFDDAPLATDLLGDGFRLVQRAWVDGWTSNVRGNGLVVAACRYATLARWVRRELAADEPLCATGNSGGAAEIGEALVWYGLDDVLDQAVTTSGPGAARVDLGCVPDAAWLAQCDAYNAASAVHPSCTYAANGVDDLLDAAYAPATPCGDADAAFVERFRADSQLGDGADLEVRHMRLDMLLGDRDGLVSFAQTQLFAAQVTAGDGGEVSLTITPGGRHGYPYVEPGAAVVRDRLVAGCVARH